METSFDDFLGGRFQLEQPLKGPRAGIDAMLLAAIVPCDADREMPSRLMGGGMSSILDAGCGSAAISLSLASRFPAIQIAGVERQPDMAALARKNIALNGFEQRINVIEADLLTPIGELAPSGLIPQSFDHVVANPPFYRVDQSRACDSHDKSAAHRLHSDELAEWIRFLTAMAVPKGTLSLVHRPESLPELLKALQGRFGKIRILPVFSTAELPAIRILVQGVKGSRAPMSLLPGLVLRTKDGGYSKEADAILRDGASFPL